ncbi:MAG: PilT/PilU family type 4a pilus ATPase [Burkholderiaceae bacterium]
MAMDQLFRLMAEKKASDIYLSAGAPITIRINGVAIPLNQEKLAPAAVLALLKEVLNERQLNALEEDQELNAGIPVQGIGSFRLSAFRQRGTVSAVLRYIPNDVPTLNSLNLPDILGELIMEKRGLVLMVGATGSGKSTSLAAMIDYRNEQRSGHILTFEDPIEYLFKNKKSIVNQREIGSDAKTLQTGLKNALRQAPDVIFIGEIRDRDTMTAAMTYSLSGHLVLATLHANNSYHALNRIVSFYSPENRPALLADLSAALKAIVSQRLVRSKSGGRVAAVEVLLNTRLVSDLIEKGKIYEIKETMEKSLAAGSQTFEQSLLDLLRADKITQEEALTNADSSTNLLWLINNQGALQQNQRKQREPEPPPTDGPTFQEFTLNA